MLLIENLQFHEYQYIVFLTFPSENFSSDTPLFSIPLFSIVDFSETWITVSSKLEYDFSSSDSTPNEFSSLLKRLRYGLSAMLAEGKPTVDCRFPKKWVDCKGNAVETELGFAGGNG